MAVLKLDQNGVSPCIFPETGKRQLMTGCGAESFTGHNELVVRDAESPRFIIATGEGSALVSSPCCCISIYIAVVDERNR